MGFSASPKRGPWASYSRRSNNADDRLVFRSKQSPVARHKTHQDDQESNASLRQGESQAPTNKTTSSHSSVKRSPKKEAVALSNGMLKVNGSPHQNVEIELLLDNVLSRFLDEELDPKHSLWDLVVLNGRRGKDGELLDPFACSVGQYIKQVWPSEEEVIKNFFDTLRLEDNELPSREEVISSQYGDLTTWMNVEPYNPLYKRMRVEPNRIISLVIEGPSGAVVPLVEAVQWLAAVLQPVDRNNGPVASTVSLRSSRDSRLMGERLSYSVVVDTKGPLKVPCHSSCWITLFPNTPCVLGFPTTSNPHEMEGVKMPFGLMWLLSGVEYEVQEEDGLVLYGAHTMLYPVRQHENCVQWHLEKLGKGGLPKETRPFRKSSLRDLKSLVGKIHFLGMWKDVQVSIGTDSINTEPLEALTDSRATQVSEKTRRSGWSTGGAVNSPTVFTVPTTREFSCAKSREPRYMVNFEKNFREKIGTPVMLYCPSKKQAWLVSYTSVALHLARVGAAYEFGTFGHSIPGCDARDDGGQAAFELVQSCHETLLKKVQPGEILTKYESKFTIGQHIAEITASMELARRKSCRARSLLQTPPNKLLGFELADIGYMRQEMKLKEFDLGPLVPGCWAPILQDIEYVFFYEGMSDPIVPTLSSNKNTMWQTIPRGFNLLTASVPVLFDLAMQHNRGRLNHLSAKLDWDFRYSFDDFQLQEIASRGKGFGPNLPMGWRKGAAVFKHALSADEIYDELGKRERTRHQDRFLNVPQTYANGRQRQRNMASAVAKDNRAVDSGYDTEEVKPRNNPKR